MIYLLLAKAEQLGLFDSIVRVAPHVRKDGTYVAEHQRHQKVRQADLFGAPEKPQEPSAKAKARRLIDFVKRKGGAERMGVLLSGQPAEVVERMVDGFVKETGLSAGQVRAVLGLGGDRKPEESPGTRADAGNQAVTAQADQEPIKDEKPADTGLAAESAPADQEPVKKPDAPRLKNYGWDAVKLSDAYSLEQLEELRQQVTAEHKNPLDADGHPLENGQPTIHLVDNKGRPKLAALAWAVTHKLKEGREQEGAAEPVTVQAATPGEEHAIPPGPAVFGSRREALASLDAAGKVAMKKDGKWIAATSADVEKLKADGWVDPSAPSEETPVSVADALRNLAGDKAGKIDFDGLAYLSNTVGLKGLDDATLLRVRNAISLISHMRDTGRLSGTHALMIRDKLRGQAVLDMVEQVAARIGEGGDPLDAVRKYFGYTAEPEQSREPAPSTAADAPSIPDQAPSTADTEPKEGDTKTVAGIEYRLQDGRWHRVTPEERDAETAPAEAPAAPIVEHVTKKGKTLRGIIRTDLTKEQAQAIDAYTFKKDGGWFIRDKHLETAAAINTAHANGHLTDEQRQVAHAANATGGPAAAKETLARDLIAKKAAKLREAGQKLAEQAAEDRNRDRLTNTARRARMAAGAEADAAQREAIGKTMMKLADAIEAGEVPALAGVTTRAAVEQLDMEMRNAMQRRERPMSYAESDRLKGRPFDDEDLRHVQMPDPGRWLSGAKSQLQAAIAGKKGAPALRTKIEYSEAVTREIYDAAEALIGKKRLDEIVGWWAPEALKKAARLERAGITSDEKLREAIDQFRQVKAGKVEADPVKIAERAIIGQKVGVDFFPTPKPLAERMAQLAGVEPGARVLEPSAGNGNLADAAKAAGAAVDTVEVSDALRKILEAKGHTLAGRDFDAFEPGEQYDAVIMNPPFSNRQDAAHIMRAWGMVRPGGKLVAIAGEGVFFGSDAKAQAFRDWLDDNGAEVEKLPAGTFEDKSLLATTSANARLIVMQKPGGPQEGDRKTVDGVEYVLEGGRWHRAMDPVPEPEPEAVAAEPDPEERRPDPDAELADDREDLREEMMNDPHSERAQELVRQIAAKEEARQAPQEAPASPERRVRAPRSTATPDDLDPNSPNYRYRDTGYIGGSRKELAAEQIKRAARDGRRMRATDIDWAGLEENPREAEEMITKSHLFGQVDWEALKAAGMEPGAGFLIDRIYASVGTEPALKGPQARQDYAIGLESLRDRLEKCQTPQQVIAILDEMHEEWEGTILNASESDAYKAARERYSVAREAVVAERDEQDKHFKAWQAASAAVNSAEWEQRKRTRRGWKPDPDLAAKIASLKPAADAAHEAFMAWKEEHPTTHVDLGGGRVASGTSADVALTIAYHDAEAIKAQARSRNLIENPITRAWATLGPRFVAVMLYRRLKGSDAFAKHVASVKVGGVKDWSWAEKEVVRTTAKKRDVSFQLRVADHFDRVGGRPVTVESTQALKEQFGLRDVQSGNWVLKDPKSAEFHVQRSAEAFADLADLLGVPEAQVSANGRLAMAFGARGKGNAGWRGAAQAQYDGVYRVINLTKLGGGGALGHEWWHAIDNLMKEAEGAGQSGKDDYATENPDLLPPGELRDAINGLRAAMLEGEHKATEEFAYSPRDYELAKHNVDGYLSNEVGKAIKAAKSAEDALAAVDQYFTGRRAPTNKKQAANMARWRTLAVAYHDGNPAGAQVDVKSGRPMSSYAFEAWKLDGGDMGKYWSQRSEMSARAFQSWIEDRLAAKGQRNDYLSVYADNKYHVDPIFGPQYPYPDGEERERINAAFDRVVEVMRQRGTLAKAFRVG